MPKKFLHLILAIAFAGCSTSPVASPHLEPPLPVFALLDPAADLLISIRAVRGREPAALTLDALRQNLGDSRVHSFTILPTTYVPNSDKPYGSADLMELHAHRPNGTDLDILFLDQAYARDKNLTGVTFVNYGLIAVFQDRNPFSPKVIPSNLQMPDTRIRQATERSTLVHELGHAWGLVNCGIPMVQPREDPQSKCHSIHQQSVMNFATHYNTDITNVRTEDGGDPVWHFDDQDWQDIRSYQEQTWPSHVR
ncbi:MAG TPA: hypothetical protein VM286_02760 [Candidatus Thermoplasmatota archaeon]|nr:hypothetical protein [Candidatus Thermoplasmatota archaeon]